MLTDRRMRAWGLVLFCLLCGCGPKFEKLPTVPVSGTVTYDGRPVPGARVSFLSSTDKGRNATGTTDSSGNFTLSTYLGGTQSAAGAVPGDYTVTVRKRETIGASGPPSDMNKIREENMEGKSSIPKHYEDATKSDLKATVKPSDNEPLKFELVD